MPYRHLFPYSLPLNKLTATCHSVQKSDILRPKSMKHISAMLNRNPGISRYRGFLSCPPIILLVKTGNGIKILNIFTFSQTDCGAYNFAALVFFCPSNKNNSLTLIFVCPRSSAITAGFFYSFYPCRPITTTFPPPPSSRVLMSWDIRREPTSISP